MSPEWHLRTSAGRHRVGFFRRHEFAERPEDKTGTFRERLEDETGMFAGRS
ncbi:hypothetical protein M9458_055098 [Cirrhinus mrigala]|uniref:MHC class I antigen n=1 Tax=Cirrhinus mrigala TaxID=683832 RepID=A0ABD0MLR3_CIRMR